MHIQIHTYFHYFYTLTAHLHPLVKQRAGKLHVSPIRSSLCSSQFLFSHHSEILCSSNSPADHYWKGLLTVHLNIEITVHLINWMFNWFNLNQLNCSLNWQIRRDHLLPTESVAQDTALQQYLGAVHSNTGRQRILKSSKLYVQVPVQVFGHYLPHFQILKDGRRNVGKAVLFPFHSSFGVAFKTATASSKLDLMPGHLC